MYWDEYAPRSARSVRRVPVRVTDTETDAYSMERSVEQESTRELPSATGDHIPAPAADESEWQLLAQRLQADMDNFRKRQIRRADEAILAERERLLQRILPVVDNLARALDQADSEDEALRKGVELTYRELMRLLESEGVTPIETVGNPFTPDLHEAVATIKTDAQPGTIVEELTKGFKIGDKLLRPARVVVAT